MYLHRPSTYRSKSSPRSRGHDILNEMIAHSISKDSLYHPVVLKHKQGFWKRILIVDDDYDITTTLKAGVEESNKNDVNKRIEVFTYNDPVIALSEFKPNFYDFLLNI
jgi:hypothetical protein